MIEAPLDLQAEQTVPQDFYDLCSDQSLPYEGNAAGNTVDLLDLDGANKSVPPLPSGFTAKGYVALVFSVVAAVLGMISITRFGSLSLRYKIHIYYYPFANPIRCTQIRTQGIEV
jgi:iron transport multicopper oxidase